MRGSDCPHEVSLTPPKKAWWKRFGFELNLLLFGFPQVAVAAAVPDSQAALDESLGEQF